MSAYKYPSLSPKHQEVFTPDRTSNFQKIMKSGKQIFGRTVLALSLTVGVTAVEYETIDSQPAAASTDGYPDADAANCSAIFGVYSWCKDENANGKFDSGDQNSTRGYDYRNCTDWVAWRIPKLGVGSVPSGLGNAANWNDKAPSSWVKDNIPEPGDIAQSETTAPFGHVGVVEKVNRDEQGTITSIEVSEYNKSGDGTYSWKTYTPDSNGIFWRDSAKTKKWDNFIDLNGTGLGINGEVINTSGSLDTDSDGFADNVDKCPKIAGTIEGCPEGQPLVSVAPNHLGGNSAYMRGSDGRLYTSWQTGYGTGWEGWVPIGANKITGAPTAINLHNGTHAIFVRGENNQALTAFQTEAGSGQWHWADLGGALTSNIVVDNAITGGKVLFAKDNRGELVHKWQNAPGGSWSEWHSLGGSLLGDPNVLKTPDGRHVVYARGTNGHLMTKWQQTPGGAWSPWTDLGGELTSSPVAQWMNNGAMVVFARDSQGRITHKWQLAPESGQWSEWVPLTNKTLSGPAVAKESDGRFSIYYADESGVLQTDWQTQPGSTWLRASLGAAIVGTPEIERSPAGALSEFTPNHNGVVTTKWQTAPGSIWTGPGVVGQVIYPAW